MRTYSRENGALCAFFAGISPRFGNPAVWNVVRLGGGCGTGMYILTLSHRLNFSGGFAKFQQFNPLYYDVDQAIESPLIAPKYPTYSETRCFALQKNGKAPGF